MPKMQKIRNFNPMRKTQAMQRLYGIRRNAQRLYASRQNKGLGKWIATVPKEKGVYVITRTITDAPTFCEVGTGGFFKGKDPNVSIKELAEKWYNCNDRIVYVGRANYDDNNPKAEKCKSTIQSRLKEYMRFGHGKNVGHKGGRYIWQLADSEELVVWFKVCNNPQTVESELIAKYEPFANLKRGDIE